MAERKIVKTTLAVTSLHYANKPLAESLAAIAEELDVGFMLGQIIGEKRKE